MRRASEFSNEDATYLDFSKMLKETELAKCYKLDTGDTLWIPKSLISCEDADDGIVGVPTWWAKKQGID